MSRTSLSLCLGVIGLSVAVAGEPAVTATLAVQEAMRQGREHLQHGEPRAAVDVLEGQLTRINGNTAYLGLLREAYSAYLKELQLAQNDELAEAYQKRLQILDKSAVATVSKQADADDPLQQTPKRGGPAERSLLSEAEKAFSEKRYAEADTLFARAFTGDAADPRHGPQWAYCKLYTVVARLKEAEAARTSAPAGELEREVAAALRLAGDDAKLAEFGRQVEQAVRRAAGERGRASVPIPTVVVTVKHQDRGNDGWARAETTNFRLMHNHPRDFAEQVLRAAEQARAAALAKWGSHDPGGDWKPVCEVYLYATAADYAKATGKPTDSPGHATYKAQSGAIIGRRLDLRADDPNLLSCVVPHETTHLVLGDLFADAPLPRWADEGMAVLAESPARVDRFIRTLHTSRRQGRLVPLDKLFTKAEYPEAALITVFYVESVSVVDFLVAEKGPQTFVQFAKDATRSGLEVALKKHYDCPNVAALQDRWLTRTFAADDARASGGRAAQ